MRGEIALLVGILPAVAGQQSYAQDLPVFDQDDFEIVSVESNSRVVARSDGRDFYCYADVNDGGYVLVWGCLPFVSRTEARSVEKALAEAEAADRVAAEEAKAAADAIAKRRRDEEIVSLAERAASAIKNPTHEIANLLAELDTKVLASTISEVARASRLSACNLKVHDGKYFFDGTIAMIAKELKLEHSIEADLAFQIVRLRTAEAVDSMIADGVLVRSADLKYVGLRECQ